MKVLAEHVVEVSERTAGCSAFGLCQRNGNVTCVSSSTSLVQILFWYIFAVFSAGACLCVFGKINVSSFASGAQWNTLNSKSSSKNLQDMFSSCSMESQDPRVAPFDLVVLVDGS